MYILFLFFDFHYFWNFLDAMHKWYLKGATSKSKGKRIEAIRPAIVDAKGNNRNLLVAAKKNGIPKNVCIAILKNWISNFQIPVLLPMKRYSHPLKRHFFLFYSLLGEGNRQSPIKSFTRTKYNFKIPSIFLLLISHVLFFLTWVFFHFVHVIK